MQRSASDRVCARSDGSTPLRAAAFAASRFCAAAVSGGSLPLRGSTISDVRRLDSFE